MHFDISLSNIFLDFSPQARDKTKNEQMVLQQTKKVCKTKETINKMKRQPTEWEKIFDKGLISKTYKALI